MSNADSFDLWIRRLSAVAEPHARLVCFPHAGGSANSFFQFARRFGDFDVYGVQYPGRQDRRNEPFRESVSELAIEVADLLGTWGQGDEPDLPVVLLGNSVGSLVAFEVALRLEAMGRAPMALYACGRVSPALLKTESTHLMSDDAFLREMVSIGGMESELLQDPEIRALVLPPMRADYRLAETYACAPGTRISTPIHVHIGDSDSKVNTAEASLWRDCTTSDFSMHMHEGGHFFFTSNGDGLVESIKDGCVSSAPIYS